MTHERMNDKNVRHHKVKHQKNHDVPECIAKDFPCIRILQNGNIIPQSHKLLDRLYHVPLKKTQIQRVKKRIKHKYRKHDERRQQKNISKRCLFFVLPIQTISSIPMHFMKGCRQTALSRSGRFLRLICTQSILPKHVLLFRNNPILISVLNFVMIFLPPESRSKRQAACPYCASSSWLIASCVLVIPSFADT